jgi:hypothetical protein
VSACETFAQHLESEALGDTDRAHAQGCRLCRALLPEAAATGPSAEGRGPNSASLERVRAAVLEAARSAPVRPWWRLGALLAVVNAATALVVSVMVGTGNWDSPAAHRPRLAAVGVLLLVSLTFGAVAALDPNRRRARAMLWLALLVPVGLVLAGNGIATARTFGEALPCTLVVCLSAVVPVVTGLVLLRGMALDGRRAMAVGLTGAAAGLFALNFECRDGSARHLLGFHVLPWLLVAALLVLVRRRLPTQSQVP